MRFVVPSVTYYPYLGATALWYLSGLPGINERIPLVQQHNIHSNDNINSNKTRADVATWKYSSASDHVDRGYVISRQTEEESKEQTDRMINYLEELRQRMINE